MIGRALACGYNLFFKAWRDSSYDAVLDHNGILFRIEIKGTRVFNPGECAGMMKGKNAIGIVEFPSLKINRIFF